MSIYKDLLILILGLSLIIKSADFFTSGAEGIAKTFRIPRIIVGLTIVSLATTAPEFTISTLSSYMGMDGMAVGNAVGSCFANIGLVLAIAAIIRVISFKPKFIKQDLMLLIISVIILYVLILDNKLSFGDGLFLFFLLVVIFTRIISRELKSRRLINKEEKTQEHKYNIRKYILKFSAGALGVILSAKYAVIPSSINIAHFLKVPEIVIALSMVALGTSLPELVTALVASFKKMGELAVGNVIGANMLNILWVLGCSSMINPLNIDIQTKKITVPIVFLMTLLLFLFSRTKFKLSRKEGVILLLIYIGYIYYIFKFAYNQI